VVGVESPGSYGRCLVDACAVVFVKLPSGVVVFSV
jgi:hypothetical protein